MNVSNAIISFIVFYGNVELKKTQVYQIKTIYVRGVSVADKRVAP